MLCPKCIRWFVTILCFVEKCCFISILTSKCIFERVTLHLYIWCRSLQGHLGPKCRSLKSHLGPKIGQKHNFLTNLSKKEFCQKKVFRSLSETQYRKAGNKMAISGLQTKQSQCQIFFTLLDSISYRPRIFRLLAFEISVFRFFFQWCCSIKILFFIFIVYRSKIAFNFSSSRFNFFFNVVCYHRWWRIFFLQ